MERYRRCGDLWKCPEGPFVFYTLVLTVSLVLEERQRSFINAATRLSYRVSE